MNLVDRLIEAIQSKPPRVLVYGDGMTDVYVNGRLEGECQEGCPKFVEVERDIVPGGAANAARSLQNWRVEVVRFVGSYKLTKTRFISEGRCVFRHDDERLRMVNQLDIHDAVMHELLHGARPIGAVLLSDYDKGMLTPESIDDVASECAQLRIPCVADVKREPLVYAGCIIKCNEEWNNKYQHPSQWNHQVSTPWVLTLGSQQCVVNPSSRYDDTHLCGVVGPPVDCINHVGAGDCFAAHMTLAMACGFFLKEAAAVAHSAGRVYVQHRHNRPPHPCEIAADMAGSCQNRA